MRMYTYSYLRGFDTPVAQDSYAIFVSLVNRPAWLQRRELRWPKWEKLDLLRARGVLWYSATSAQTYVEDREYDKR